MRLVHIIHGSHYLRLEERFSNMAFSNSPRSGGISVISSDCIERVTGNICRHINYYYPDIAGNPIIYLEFDDTELPEEHEIHQETSPSGDECHHNIRHPRKAGARFFRNLSLDTFKICQDEVGVPLTVDIAKSCVPCKNE